MAIKFSSQAREVRRTLAVAGAVALTAGLLGGLASRGWSTQSVQQHLTLTGGKTESNPGISLYNGGVSIQPNAIGVMFGPTVRLGKFEKMRYLMLINYGGKHLDLGGAEIGCHSDGVNAGSDTSFTINGKPLTFSYKVKGTRDTQKIVSESLTFNGTPVHLDKGAVLLLDLRGAKPTLWQTHQPLPPPGYDESTEQVEAHAEVELAALKQQSAEVREFVR